MNIKIDYDGAYPNLCSGTLKVTIDDTQYVFPDYCLSSGGTVYFDENWSENVSEGDWSVTKWPNGFPEKYKQLVTEAINTQVNHGCCGGCV